MLTLYYLMKKSKNNGKLKANEYYSNVNTMKSLNFDEDLSFKCRVCLQEGSFPIHGNDYTSLILEALQILGNIQVNENDDYPKFLCDVCHEFIMDAISFRKVARQSNEILKKPVEKPIFDHTYSTVLSNSSNNDTKQSEKEASEDDCEVNNETELKSKGAPKVPCDICKKLISKKYYKDHMTMHNPNHPRHVCDICGKSFRLRTGYRIHILQHKNDYPHKCQYCPYRASHTQLLKAHMRRHTSDYRYMCTECPAQFVCRNNLTSHLLKHTEPQFKCDICERAFHREYMLQRHVEADHLGIKNHICDVCGKAFGYRNAMMQHQRWAHNRAKMHIGKMPAYLLAQKKSKDAQ